MNKKEIIDHLNSDGSELFQKADDTRKKFKGDGVHLRGLIEFSSFCKRNCAYCGLRAENKLAKRYRLSEDEIIKIAKKGADIGYKTVVLQSGEDDFYSKDKISRLVEKIKKFDLKVTLSLGEKSYEEYREYKNSGADRYLLRIETTDVNLYKALHPKMSFENRVNCLYNLKELGYETGTGSLVGLPNQTVESLADDILFYKKLNADMIGIGPFIPHPETPLKDASTEKNFELALKMMAITRLILPEINIPATTAMETLNKEGRIIALNSGANVIMPNITILEARKKYTIYPGKTSLDGTTKDSFDCISKKLNSINRFIL